MTDDEVGDAPGSPLVLHVGTASACIYPAAGGRLGQLDFGRGALLRGPAAGLGWANWGCYPLLPWSNRIPGGHLRFGTIDVRLPVNWPDGSAIHGLAASCPWTVTGESATVVDLEVDVAAGPYLVHGTQSFTLEPAQLHLRLAATNDGERAVPMGIGIHPWFRYGSVRVAAEARWPGEPLPTGRPVPVEGPYDLRRGSSPEPMDACFTSLTEPGADVPGARLHWEGPVTNVVVYSREPGWVCVEPVTMANDGFRMAASGAPARGVIVVEPGGSIEVRYRFESSSVPERSPSLGR